MPKPAKKADGQYFEVGYRDKVVFTSRKQETKSHANVVDLWRKSQGLWAKHPVFRGMNAKDIVEWLRGEDADA